MEHFLTAEEAVRRIKEYYKVGDTFTLPEVFGDEWTGDRERAGELGKEFRRYLENGNVTGIRAKGNNRKGHAVYEVYM